MEQSCWSQKLRLRAGNVEAEEKTFYYAKSQRICTIDTIKTGRNNTLASVSVRFALRVREEGEVKTPHNPLTPNVFSFSARLKSIVAPNVNETTMECILRATYMFL